MVGKHHKLLSDKASQARTDSLQCIILRLEGNYSNRNKVLPRSKAYYKVLRRLCGPPHPKTTDIAKQIINSVLVSEHMLLQQNKTHLTIQQK